MGSIPTARTLIMSNKNLKLKRISKRNKQIVTILQFVVAYWEDVGYEVLRRIRAYNVTRHPDLLYWIEEANQPATLPEDEDNIIKGYN